MFTRSDGRTLRASRREQGERIVKREHVTLEAPVAHHRLGLREEGAFFRSPRPDRTEQVVCFFTVDDEVM